MEILIKVIFGLLLFFFCDVINRQEKIAPYWRNFIVFNLGMWFGIFIGQ